jgi:hypothetical protein
MASLLQLLLYAAALVVFAGPLASVGAFPVGLNLPPLGEKDLGGRTANVNWAPVSTYVFTDLYKHCSALYIRTVSTVTWMI